MDLEVKIDNERLSGMRDAVAQRAREICLSAAYELKVVVQGHLRTWASTHHATARRLGARPTGHFETAARDITAAAESRSASVLIPAPGITRYFRSLSIAPVRAKALTIPIHPSSYGRRAKEMRHLGWKLFSRKGILFGDKGDGAEALYSLKKKVTIPKDETILPSSAKMEEAVLDGARAAINMR